MRASLLALAVAACASAAYAADLPTHKAPAPPPVMAAPAFSWTGAYVGGFVGGNWSKTSFTDLTRPGQGVPSVNTNGLTAGGLVGYNWGFPGASSFVIGGELEAGFDRRSGNATYDLVQRNISVLGDGEGRLRGRIGYAWGNVLLFGAGGGTLADLKVTNVSLGGAGLPAGFQQNISHVRGGFNVGGGLEWAFDQHWIVRGEYIYDRFGSRLYDFNGLNANGFDSKTAKLQESTARAVLAYKF